jgi:hypothetical protein
VKEIYTFKDKVKQLIDQQPMKVWLSKKRGKRVECIVTVGTEQFLPPMKIFETDDYILLGQNIDEGLKKQLTKEVKRYAENT